jgi:zinc protease
MLLQGSLGRTASATAEAFDAIGASIECSSGPDAIGLTFSVLAEHMDEALRLTAEAALSPAFAEAETERTRGQLLAGFAQRRKSPASLADEAFLAAVFGAAHPYGRPPWGREAAVGKMTSADLRACWQRSFAPQHAVLIVAGPMEPGEVRALAERHFGSWRASVPSAPVPQAPPTPRPVVALVDLPGAPQSILRFGHVGLSRAAPDYPAIRVMSAILGGMFTSRLNLNLRERHGFTYGVQAGVDFRRGAGPFTAATSTATATTAAALREIHAEFLGMRSQLVTAEELASARLLLARTLPAAFATSAQAVQSLGQLFLCELPLGTFASLPAAYEGVTAEDVRQAAESHLSPRSAVAVVAGDAARIRPSLLELNLGPVEVFSAGSN